MAQATKIITVCDLHRGEELATGKVAIAIDGEKVAFDVCDTHLREIRSKCRPWLNKAARLNGSAPRATRKTTRPKLYHAAKVVRAWAVENGYDVPARGRIPTAVKQAYQQAN